MSGRVSTVISVLQNAKGQEKGYKFAKLNMNCVAIVLSFYAAADTGLK